MIARLLIGIISLYKRFISPHLPNRCRFHPTCASYAIEALEKRGALTGSLLALKRVAKCHPLHPGGVDKVPEKRPDFLIPVNKWE